MRVVIAEDSAVLRDGLAQLLGRNGHEVLAAVDNGESLVSEVERLRPDATVVDVRMPPSFTDEGLRAALTIRAAWPQIGILVFSQYVETRYASDLLARGANGVGYLLKDRVTDVKDFLDALERVSAGGTALDPEVVTQLMGSNRQNEVSALSPREREVLALMAEGRTNAAIAQRLVVSERAVEKHVANIFLKLDLPPSDTDHRRVLAVLKFLES